MLFAFAPAKRGRESRTLEQTHTARGKHKYSRTGHHYFLFTSLTKFFFCLDFFYLYLSPYAFAICVARLLEVCKRVSFDRRIRVEWLDWLWCVRKCRKCSWTRKFNSPTKITGGKWWPFLKCLKVWFSNRSCDQKKTPHRTETDGSKKTTKYLRDTVRTVWKHRCSMATIEVFTSLKC